MSPSPGTVTGFVPLPHWQPDRLYWRTVWRCVVWGPLLGGLPINVFIIPIPLSYLFGGVPALIGGLLYALWRHAPALRAPGPGERVLFGALCGGAGLLICATVMVGPAIANKSFAILLTCATFGGAVTAWRESSDNSESRTPGQGAAG